MHPSTLMLRVQEALDQVHQADLHIQLLRVLVLMLHRTDAYEHMEGRADCRQNETELIYLRTLGRLLGESLSQKSVMGCQTN